MNSCIRHIAVLLVVLLGLPDSLQAQPKGFPQYEITQEKFYTAVQSAPTERIEAIVAAITDIDTTDIVFNGEVFEWLPEKRAINKTQFSSRYRINLPDLPDEFYLKKSPRIAATKITGVFNNKNELLNIGLHGIFFRVENLLTSGRCYAKALIADQYETISEQVLVNPANIRTEIIPAQYETATERVLVNPARKKIVLTPAVFDTLQEQVLTRSAFFEYTIVPAQYETVTEQVASNEASTRIERVPAEYETVTESIKTDPASTKWVKRKAERNCESADPNDCLVWTLVETPAQYKTLTRQVRKGCPSGYEDDGDDCIRTVEVPAEYTTRTFRKLISPEKIDSTLVPAQYEEITKVVLVEAAERQVEKIPAEYTTVTKRMVKTPASTRTVEIPAEYSTVTKRQLIKPGGFTEWKEVLCNENITPDLIRKIRAELKKRGYVDPSADITSNRIVFDSKLKGLLTKFQKDNGLPIGNLDLETLTALDIEH